MKMSTEHFTTLKQACERVLITHPNMKETYVRSGHSSMRFRWDVLHASKFDTRMLYSANLNDEHIDTALRHIMGDHK